MNATDKIDAFGLLQAVASGTSDLVFVTDEYGVFVFVSDTVIDMLGYLPDKIMAMESVAWLLGRDYLPEILKVQSEYHDRHLVSVIDRNGREHVLQISMTHAPETEGMFLYICRDVTGNKMLHSELDELRERLELLNDDTIAGDIFVDQDMKIRQISNKACVVFGVDCNEVIGENLITAIPILRGSMFENECRQALSKKSAGSFETSFGAPQSDISYQIILNPVSDGLNIFLRSTPGNKQLLNRNRRNAHHYQLLAEYIKDVFWITQPGPSQQVEYISPAYEQIWGYSAAELYRDPDAWLQYIDESDRERVVQAIEIFEQSGVDLDIEYRVKRGDGEVRWVNMHGYLVHNESGEIEYIVGVVQDITRRKESELKLRMSEEKYRSLLDHAHFTVFVFDGDGVFTYVNKTTIGELGVESARDVVGKTLWDIFPQEYADRMIEHYNKCFISRESVIVDEQYIRYNGEKRLIQTHIQPIPDENGSYTLALAMASDITDMKSTEEKYRTIIEGSNFVISSVDYDGRLLFMNQFAARLFGSEPDDLRDKTMWDMFPKTIADKQVGLVRKAIDCDETVSDIMETMIGPERRWVEAIILPLHDVDGVCHEAMAMVHDITEQKATQEALAVSEYRYSFLFNEMQEGFALHEMLFDENGEPIDFVYLEVNPAFERIIDMKSSELIGKKISEIIPGVDQRIINLYGKVVITGKPIHFTHQNDDKTTLEISAFRPQEGQFAVILKDITVRVRAEEMTRESEKLLRDAQKMARLGNWQYDVRSRRIIWSDEMYRLHGIDPEDTERSSRLTFFLVHRDDRRKIIYKFTNAVRDGVPFEYVYRTVPVNGETRYLQIHTECEFDPNGIVITLSGTVQDITDQMRVQKALREREEQYRALFKDGGSIGIIFNPVDGRIVDANDAAIAFYGYPYEVLLTKSVFDLNTIPPEEVQPLIENTLNSRQTHYELKHRLADNTIRDVEIHTGPVKMKGKTYLYSLILDVTEQKQLEVQFTQAQRMETIGRLAGGVAHDFNNLLTVISGNAEIALMSISEDNPLYEEISEIIASSNRASKLTRQLLAFSRRQVIEPKVVVLNDIFTDMDKMLRRLIGEEYQLTTTLSDDLWKVNIDPGQVEQVITNLVVNSRDAMPGGGTITIRTENITVGKEPTGEYSALESGDFVSFSVTDTGMGIDESLKQYIFEPFFTTKEKGRGTGLGLSTCYGIVKQSHGHIEVDSMIGRGTTMNVYLPRFIGEGVQYGSTSEEDVSHTGNGEKILVVEDDKNLNRMITKVLDEHDYHIYQAGNGMEALNIITSRGLDEIDLIITDVIMPRMGGGEMVKKIRSMSTDAKVLFISGYTDQTIEREGILDDHAEFLSKPFTPASLLKKVRSILDE